MNIGMIITILAIVVIIAVAILFWKPVNMLVKSKTTQTDYETIIKIAETGVGWAAQWLWDKDNETKRLEVLGYIERECCEKGLQVNVDTMEKALEAAYRKIKVKQPPDETE